jgi:hypothetical protein
MEKKEIVFGQWLPIADYDLYHKEFKKIENANKDKVVVTLMVASFDNEGWCLGAFHAWKDPDATGKRLFKLGHINIEAEDILYQKDIFKDEESYVEELIFSPITHFMFTLSP